MAEILGAASAGTKLFLEVNAISIDNWTFKLFYKATTTLCLACSVVASSKQFFGDPINCEVVSSVNFPDPDMYPDTYEYTEGERCYWLWMD